MNSPSKAAAAGEEEVAKVFSEFGNCHITLKMVGCRSWNMIDDPALVITHLRKGAELAGMTVVGTSYHKFNPQGLTAGIFLAESHVDYSQRVYFHNWPEKRLAVMIDICACRPKNISACVAYYIKAFNPSFYIIEDNEEKAKPHGQE